MIEGREEKQHKHGKERGGEKEESIRRIINRGKREQKSNRKGKKKERKKGNKKEKIEEEKE